MSYLFTEMHGKHLCLVCLQQVSVLKEYNSWGHYETHHGTKMQQIARTIDKREINELLGGLSKHSPISPGAEKSAKLR